MLTRLLIAPVMWYRRFVSPLKRTPTCRYLPTCSEYAIEALQAHGAARGTLLAAARVLRCNPLFHGGYHPVPSARRALVPGTSATDNHAAEHAAEHLGCSHAVQRTS